MTIAESTGATIKAEAMTDNLTSEPATADNSTDVEPETGAETASVETQAETKTEVKEIPESYLKKIYGENIPQLSETEKRALTKAYEMNSQAEKAMHEKAQEAAELKRKQEHENQEAQKTSLENTDKALDYKYQTALSNLQAIKEAKLQEIRAARAEERITDSDYESVVSALNEQIADLKTQLKDEYGQISEENKTKKTQFTKEQTARAFQEIEAKNTEKLSKDEYKVAYDAYKESFGFPEDVEKFVFPVVEKVIAAYEQRKAKEASINKENDSAKSKLSTSGGLTPSSTLSMADLDAMTWEQINKVKESDPDLYKKWIKSD